MEPNNNGAEFARTLENIPSSEYEQALELIRSFSEKNLDSIGSLDELAEATSGLGDALMKVSHVKGKLTPQKAYLYAPGIEGREEDVEDAMIENPENIFSMTTNGDQFVTLSFKPYGEPPIEGSYEATLPVAQVNAPSEDSLFLGRVGGWMQIDSKDVYFQPRKNPADPQTLKSYANLIKQGVGELLKTNPSPPADVPAAFLQ